MHGLIDLIRKYINKNIHPMKNLPSSSPMTQYNSGPSHYVKRDYVFHYRSLLAGLKRGKK